MLSRLRVLVYISRVPNISKPMTSLPNFRTYCKLTRKTLAESQELLKKTLELPEEDLDEMSALT